MTSDTRQRVKQPEKNNKFKKIIIDTYKEEYAIVAEAEDLIVEYCVREKAITNLCAKEEEPKNQHWKMRKRHLRDWPDNTRERIIRRCHRIPRTIGTSEAPHCPFLNNYTVYGVDADDIRGFRVFVCFVDCHITALIKIK